MQTYHNKTVQQTAELLGTDIKTGLTHDEVKKRLHHYGKNELIEKKKKNIFIKFLEQFNDFMIIILLAAAAVSFITSIMQGDADITEPVIILAIVVWITTRYPTKKNISILPMFFLNYIRFLIYFLGGYSIYFNIQIF